MHYPNVPDILIGHFDTAMTEAVVRLWRAGFEHGVGVEDPHPIEQQAAFFVEHVLPDHAVLVALADGVPVGFIAFDAESVNQLYVRVDHIGQGIGARLLQRAKDASAGRLWLYTFARNGAARRFYRRHGFIEVAFGFEPTWQLDDVRLEWVADGAGRGR
jgi:GNAT superfamily N-acetyltransferase